MSDDQKPDDKTPTSPKDTGKKPAKDTVSSPDPTPRDEGITKNADTTSLQEDNTEDTETLGSAYGDLSAVYNVPVQVSAVLGRTHMPVNQLLKLGRGAVVELDRRIGEAIDIFVNNKLVARGEVVVVDDRLGITMTEIIKADRH